MNILLINHYAGSPELGMEFRPYYLSREWVRQGHNVLVIGASFSHLRKNQPSNEFETIDGVSYCWLPINTYKGNGIGRVVSMFCFVLSLYFRYKRVLSGFVPQLVIASSTYPLDIYPANRIAKCYGAKLVFEVHDLWPLSPIEIGGYSKYHPFIMLMQKAENDAYRYCNKVVSLLPNAVDHMTEHGLLKNKFIYVPNGFNMDEWITANSCSRVYSDFFYRLKSNRKKILGYTGGHAKSNALDFLLDAMKLVDSDDIVCVLVGSGQEKARLVKRVIDEGVDNVFFLESVIKSDVPALLSQMDVLYIGWEKNPLYRFGISPNKLIDYMMSKKPILHSVNAANDWVREYNCGISVDAESPSSIANGIMRIFSLSEERMIKMGNNGYSYAVSNLDYSILAKKFLDSCFNK